MGTCKRIKILFKLLPFKSWQCYLLPRHLLKCPDCLEDLAGFEEARSAPISKEKIRDVSFHIAGLPDKVGPPPPRRNLKLKKK